MPKVLWTMKRIQEVSPEEIGKMKEGELEKLVNATRKQVERRIKRIEKSGLYSHAAAAYEESIAKHERLPDPRVMTINQMRAEMSSHQSFLKAKTSTVKGIKDVNRQQDLRIFGPKTPGGKTPKHTMDHKERVKFWRFYNEFEHQHKRASWDSTRVQQIVREEIDNLGPDSSIGAILNNAFIRLQMENGPVYENGRRVSMEDLEASYTSGHHDLNYWRKEFYGF